MIKKIYDFCYNNGIVLMVVGFFISIVSFLIFFQTRFHGTATPRVAIGCTIAGFVIYIIGQIFVAVSRRQSRKASYSDAATKKD
jgi:uncharacterized membrane protein